jgi:hypothetical protein
MTYKAMKLYPGKGICHLEGIKHVPRWAHMQNGEPQSGKFPPEAEFNMNPEFPKDIKLADALVNLESLLVFSEKLVDFLNAQRALKNNEVLPVTIVNHKKRKEKARYFVVHQINRPKCVDEKQTVGLKSTIEKSQYQHMNKLVLLPGTVDPEVCIFRAAEYPNEALFRADLADKITAGGFTGGIEFFELDQFDDNARFQVMMARYGAG